jgi:hypothetical protein
VLLEGQMDLSIRVLSPPHFQHWVAWKVSLEPAGRDSESPSSVSVPLLSLSLTGHLDRSPQLFALSLLRFGSFMEPEGSSGKTVTGSSFGTASIPAIGSNAGILFSPWNPTWFRRAICINLKISWLAKDYFHKQ